jgi:hypothetical protein
LFIDSLLILQHHWNQNQVDDRLLKQQVVGQMILMVMMTMGMFLFYYQWIDLKKMNVELIQTCLRLNLQSCDRIIVEQLKKSLQQVSDKTPIMTDLSLVFHLNRYSYYSYGWSWWWWCNWYDSTSRCCSYVISYWLTSYF